jgi:hypothetical protein
MDKTLFYWIAGLFSSLLIGYWGIWYARKTKSKTSLAFVIKEFIPLFKTITKSFNSLEIKYKGILISENLVLIKASLVNNGNNDIDKSAIVKPISISLPSHYKCIEVTPTNISEGVNADISIDNNIIAIDWDLLKQREFISFDFLIETIIQDNKSSIGEDGLNSFKINHRISNLNKVEKYKIDINRAEEQFKPINLLGSLMLPTLFLLGGIFLILTVIFEFKDGISYKITNDGIKKKFRVTYINDTVVKVTSKIDTLNYITTKDQLQEKFGASFDLRKTRKSLYGVMILGLVGLGGGLLLNIVLLRPNPKKRIYQILKNTSLP